MKSELEECGSSYRQFWEGRALVGKAALANFWGGVPWRKAAIAEFLAEKLPSLPLAKEG